MKRDSGWVKLLGDRLAKNGAQYSVVNASISGETTSGGRTRLASLLERHRPAIVIIELGANDGLRGLPLAQMRDNLRAMIEASQKRRCAKVLLVGMRIPPNYGREYSERFAAIYADLARSEKAALVPFFFEGFARQDGSLPGRPHPSERGRPAADARPRLAAVAAAARAQRAAEGMDRTQRRRHRRRAASDAPYDAIIDVRSPANSPRTTCRWR